MGREKRWQRAIGAAALLVMLTGCLGSSPKVSYYTLSPVATAAAAGAGPLAVAVGPADFPKSLDRVQIATRKGPNRIEYDEFNRWAGTLDADFLDVTAINLGRLLGTDRIVVYPTPAAYALDYRVMFDVIRFEADAGGSVTLEARWIIEDGKGDVVDTGSFQTVKASAGDGYEARAAAHSAAVGELAGAVASVLHGRPTAG